MRAPLTSTESRVGSTQAPSTAVVPLTRPRPASISVSQVRRLPSPAEARTFCKRTCSASGAKPSGGRGDIVLIEQIGVREIVTQRRQLAQVVQSQPLQEVGRGPVEDRTGLGLTADLGHQTAG